ncbi:glycerol-3-phosphate 1-O-acyltransferase PlsB [Saccharospirillum salsuginis]|uniref:Glycerol-3-phosphate acyltransferase n=1 Tax=Saccharospirillum salsuginis TaxID=418750 RepID=A0A918KIP2_9GAMM|nr:glycerol-3-phosphate 1-O-acyltransferase PlsB [Saccharospirillum salsuginis]GGX64480.1 glycerol-3-phosphate acyltransferase [Saccharospirillum salsuginis]
MRSLLDRISRFFQRILFWWVKLDNKPPKIDFEPLRAGRPVVYVLEQQSTADAMVLDHQCRKLGLPHLGQRLQLPGLEGKRPLISIHPRPSVLRRRRSGVTPMINALLSYLDEHPEEDILLVPVALYWGRGAHKSDSLLQAILSSNWSLVGRFKKLLTVLFNGRNTYFELNEPISLRRLVTDEPDVAVASRKVARVLRVHFRRVRSAVIGPDLSHRRVLIQQLLNSPPVRKAIDQHARSKGVSREKAERLAARHATNIAADVSYNVIRVMDVLLTWLWNRIYNGVLIRGLDRVRKLAEDHEIVYVPCHRSHMDYLLLSYSLYKQGLNVPHIAAGDNLNMPVVGGILRRGGAFFLRRRFGGDKLYTAVFNEYIHSVFSRGYPVEYFIEGGRSRTGRMRSPATGTVAMTVRSHLRDHSRPIVFIPVYIGYEKVFESRSYLSELQGKEKKKENLFDLVKSVRRLKNYGQVYLNFGEPLRLIKRLNEEHPDWVQQSYGPEDRPSWIVPFVDGLARDIVTRINAAAALNPINMIALTLLATSRQAIDGALLNRQLKLLIDLQQHQPYSPYMTLPEGTPDDWISYAMSMGMLHQIPQKLGDLYGLDSQNAVLLSYYRNNVQHLYALPSLVAALLGQGQGIDEVTLRERIRLIYPYIKSELFLSPTVDEAESQLTDWLLYLAEQGLVEQHEGRWHAALKGTARRLQLEMLGAIMLPTLERYLLTLAVLARLGSARASTTELENQSQQMAQRVSVLNGLNAPEFFDKALFKNFIQTLKNRGAIEVNSDQCIEFDDRIIRVIMAADSVVPAPVLYNIMQVTGLRENDGDQSEMERSA